MTEAESLKRAEEAWQGLRDLPSGHHEEQKALLAAALRQAHREGVEAGRLEGAEHQRERAEMWRNHDLADAARAERMQALIQKLLQCGDEVRSALSEGSARLLPEKEESRA